MIAFTTVLVLLVAGLLLYVHMLRFRLDTRDTDIDGMKKQLRQEFCTIRILQTENAELRAERLKHAVDSLDSAAGFKEQNAKLVTAIQKHRDAQGHGRCWRNDRELYLALGSEPGDPCLPPLPEFMHECAAYWQGQCAAAEPDKADTFTGFKRFRELDAEKSAEQQKQLLLEWARRGLANPGHAPIAASVDTANGAPFSDDVADCGRE